MKKKHFKRTSQTAFFFHCKGAAVTERSRYIVILKKLHSVREIPFFFLNENWVNRQELHSLRGEINKTSYEENHSGRKKKPVLVRRRGVAFQRHSRSATSSFRGGDTLVERYNIKRYNAGVEDMPVCCCTVLQYYTWYNIQCTR